MIIPPQNMTSVYGLIHKINMIEAENANSFKKSEQTTSATTFEKLSAQVDAQIQEAEATEKRMVPQAKLTYRKLRKTILLLTKKPLFGTTEKLYRSLIISQ